MFQAVPLQWLPVTEGQPKLNKGASGFGGSDVRVLHYERRGPYVELMIEQVVGKLRCPSCAAQAAQAAPR